MHPLRKTPVLPRQPSPPKLALASSPEQLLFFLFSLFSFFYLASRASSSRSFHFISGLGRVTFTY